MSFQPPKTDDDEADISLDQLDDLLQALSAEEIEELNGDFDPDNSLLPPSQRCKEHTSKGPTGPFSRQKLLSWLEEKAKNEKDWETTVPFSKSENGKKFVAQKEAKTAMFEAPEDQAMETEWDEILTAASEEELVDLAAVLGFHSMLTQTQYYAGLEDRPLHEGGFGGNPGMAQAQKLRIVPNEPDNMTDVEESIKKLKANDAELKTLNLNNIKNISIERLMEVCAAVKSNTVLVRLDMAGVAATDRVAEALASSIEENSTLKSVNMESNYIGGQCILTLVRAINIKQSVIELKLANQKPEVLGNKVEMEMTHLMKANKTLLRLGLQFEFPDARIKVHESLKNNLDIMRQRRIGKESAGDS